MDYEHRFQQIEFLIQLYQWSEFSGNEIKLFEQYFEWTNGKKGIESLESKTRMYLPDEMEKSFIEPDGVCKLRTEKGEKLFLFELHRGVDVGRWIEQLAVHREVIKKGIAMKKYGSERNSRLIVVFEKERTQKGVIKRLRMDEEFEVYKDYVISKHREETGVFSIEQFDKGWINGVGEKVDMI